MQLNAIVRLWVPSAGKSKRLGDRGGQTPKLTLALLPLPAGKKILRVMKLTAFILLAFCLQASSRGLSQSVTFSGTNVPLEKIFAKIKRQTGYVVVGDYNLINKAKPVTIHAEETPLERFIAEVLKNQGISYTIKNTTISIRRKPAPATERATFEFPLPPPPIDVTGRVLTEAGEPLSGVTVTVKGTNKMTATNDNGEFTLTNVNDNAVLQFSSVGFEDMEEPVRGRRNLSIGMKMSLNSLEETVVIGYGSKKRQHVTSAVSTVGSEAFQTRPIANTLNGLQGQVPGLIIQRTNGQPGNEGFDLNVRGQSSTNGGNAPLVLIDGVAGGNLDLINPDDIESVSVLKDAAASIYGARAANGVFLVTTKKGKRGKPRVSYNNNFAIMKLRGLMESPTNYQFALMENEANLHAGAVPLYTPELLEKARTEDPNPIPHPLYAGWVLNFTTPDWYGEAFEDGFMQKHNVAVSGGSENSSYYLSGSMVDQNGVVRHAKDNNLRYNVRLNYDYTLNKWLKLESKLSYEDQKRTDVGGSSGRVTQDAVFGMPYNPIRNKNGDFLGQGGFTNGVANATKGATAKFLTRNVTTNFRLIADVLPGLKLTAQTGISYRTQKDFNPLSPVPLYSWEGVQSQWGIVRNGISQLDVGNSENLYKNFTAYLDYNKTIGQHDFSVMAGASHEENTYEWFTTTKQGVVSSEVWSLNLATGNVTSNGGGQQWAIRSLFSRASYSFANKYMVEANVRYDGSSRFEPNGRWGLFPGVSAAWRISREKFMSGIRLFDDLKFRVSYGESGNQEGIGLYDYLQLILLPGRASSFPSGYPFGPGNQVQSAALGSLVSLDRTWETLATQNVGVDATMLRSRLSFTFDYFVKRNKNMLIPVTYPSLLGATAPFSNSGEMKTTGFESSLGWSDRIGDFSYSARVIFSDAQNEIVRYAGANSYVLGLNAIRQGFPYQTYFAYQYDGVIRTQAELDAYKQLGGVPGDIGIGDARFADVNGDGKISLYGDPAKAGDDGDVINVGTLTPRYLYGINLGARFKNFDFSLFAQGVGKRTMFRTGEYAIPWSDWWRQPPLFYFNQTWNEDRPNAPLPRLSHGNIRYWNYQASTLQKVNAAYIRLKNIQVGYTLPQNLMRKLRIASARVYLSGDDLWEKHSVKGGWDPESSANGFNYPFQRFYSCGLDITF